MSASFFFYDLETSSINARSGRIMQFAGQRTDMNLQPVGEPVNILVKLAGDVLPDPDALFITGITPQQTLQDGVTEAEFASIFQTEIVQADTIFVGYNNVRFDDEFMRHLLWRNFYDAYEWQWANGCSKWDLLDVVRMTRALRPEGIEWPVTDEGKPTNRLELLTKMNGLDHEHAHDALSDVLATIAVANLIKTKQPDLFNYLLEHRHKKSVRQLITAKQPFVYSSGRYPSVTWCTSVAVLLTETAQQDGAIVFDLRHDPTPFLAMNVSDLVAAWSYQKDPDAVRLPVKNVKYNHCPAVAPLGVMKAETTQQRLDLTLDTVTKHLELLKAGQTAFVDKLQQAVLQMDENRTKALATQSQHPVDEQLYDGFVPAADKTAMRTLRATDGKPLHDKNPSFQDPRLQQLLPLYRARNFATSLSTEERAAWDMHVKEALFSGGNDSKAGQYFQRLQVLAQGKLTEQQHYLLEELQLYGQSILPVDEAA